jgi:hypothetical protein
VTERHYPARLTTLVLITGLAVAACGSGTATSAATARSDGSAVATAAASPSDAASEVASSERPSASQPALPSFDLRGLMQNLASLDSYRIAITINGAPTYQATEVMKPEKAEAIILGTGVDTTRVIRIGEKRWLATGSEAYQEVPPSMVDRLVGSFDPINLLDGFANGNVGAVASNVGIEQKNGISSDHYRIDSTSPPAGGFPALPAGAAIDFWVAHDGYLVAYSLTGVSILRSIDITNVNDPANRVERPS